MHIFFVVFFTSTSYFQMDIYPWLIRVGKTSATQLGCIFSWGIDFWSIYQRPGTLCIDLETSKTARAVVKLSRNSFLYQNTHFLQILQTGVCISLQPQSGTHCSTHFHPSLIWSLAPRNRSTEWHDADKSFRNRFYVQKYISAVVRKSFQLELVAEIDPFENNLY